MRKDIEIKVKFEGTPIIDEKCNMKDFDLTIGKVKKKLWGP
jgi:hypothetical protein